MADGVYQRMQAEGRARVLGGDHRSEVHPWQSGRWGPSVVLLPTGQLAERLDQLTGEVSELIGDGHWLSGRLGRAHLTIRALELYADEPIQADPLERYNAAMTAASKGCLPICLELDGVVLSSSGVMIRAMTPDGRADEVRDRFGSELGHDGWLEDELFKHGRDPIWYCTILHFAGPIRDPERLVGWVDERASLDVGSECFESLALCEWRLDALGMAPTVLAT